VFAVLQVSHRLNQLLKCLLDNINVKNYSLYRPTHVNGDRPSHIENSNNKKSYFTISLHIVVRQCAAVYSKITFFIFAVFDVRRSVAVNMCKNCSFFTLIFAVFLLMSSPISCRTISRHTVNQTFDLLVVNLC